MSAYDLLLLLPLALPVLHLIAAASAYVSLRWRVLTLLSAAGLATAVVSATFALTADRGDFAAAIVSPAPASHLLAVLIGFLGLIISHFSRNYLAGESRIGRYAATLHLALAAVSVVVLTDNLLVLAAAWTAISLALHELLLFYPERPRAALAAHKKFIFARIAEIALFGAALLLFNVHGTWQISTIVAAYPAELTFSEQFAALLLASAALIKCAQLPMHGWLIQVVEAPTPVSALLHAGIINLGGYLMILFAPLLASAAPATWLLLVVAGTTTVLASLIMTTRVTIKVKLAWSTAAQMGIMLIECALGLYELALLHLMAHACYKAYLFLGAGSVVEQHVERKLAPAKPTPLKAWFGAGIAALAVSLFAAQLFAPGGPVSPWLLLAAFLTMFLVERDSVSRGALGTTIALALVLGTAFVTQKLLLGAALDTSALANAAWLADLWVAALILAIIAGYSFLRQAPRSEFAQSLTAWLYAGLYLDEWVTRTTLRLWPARLPFGTPPKRLRTLKEEID